MPKLTPQQFQEKHARRLKGATEDIRMGVDRVTEAPTKAAAAKKDKMRQRLVESIDSGKWERGLNRVSLEDWKKSMTEKGIGRIASGIDGAADKVVSFAGEFLPFLDNVQKKVRSMPDITLEDSIARMTTQVREVAKFQRKG